MAIEERTFQIQLPSLIQLLAQNLYAEPDVFLRELIQNAHDSIARRGLIHRTETGEEPPPPRIHVIANRAQETIQIHDNGAGLTRAEIDDHLSTIGRSGTDEFREAVREGDRNRSVNLIGQFGIGLLSAYIVAEQVTVLTKAHGHEALLWSSYGGAQYTVEPAERTGVGSTVTLCLREEFRRYLQPDRLRSIIRTYADFIGMPIYVNDEPEPANVITAPWQRTYATAEARDRAYFEFWNGKFTTESSLHVFAVDEAFEWDDVTSENGTAHGRVTGVLAITDRRLPDVNARGVVDVYVKRMFISAGNRELLPPWGKFLQGVLECDELTPNAARDNVVRNAAQAAVQKTLGDLIVRELMELSTNNHKRFVEIMRWHSYHVLAMAVQEEYDSFFRSVADLMPLESDQGPITIPEYTKEAAKRTDGSSVVYYITERGSASQYFLLANARSMRVFNCAEPFAERFLERYAEIWPQRIHLARLDVTGSDTIFEPLAPDDEQSYAALRATCNVSLPHPGLMARMTRFRPSEVPAVLTETPNSRSRREMEDVAQMAAIPPEIREIVNIFLQDDHEPLSLHLNADNPTIRQLASWPNLGDTVSRHALVSLYNNARLMLGRLRVQEVQQVCAHHDKVIELMLSLAAERAEFERTLSARAAELAEIREESDTSRALDPFVSCFVAMPYDEASNALKIYEAIRDVLEDAPYFWRVVRADDTAELPGMWDNLKRKLSRAHCCIAIFCESVNPNVMMEIGYLEALARPLLLMRDASAPDLPADLLGKLTETVDLHSADLVTQVRAALERQTALRGLQGDRYLSPRVLMRYAKLDEQVSRQIASQYETWTAFRDCDPNRVARVTGLKPTMVDGIKEAIAEVM